MNIHFSTIPSFGRVYINKVLEYYPEYNIKREGRIYALGFIFLDFTKTIKVNIKCEHNEIIEYRHLLDPDGDTSSQPICKYCSKCNKILEEY